MKNFSTAAALAVMLTGPAFAAGTQDCADGSTCHYNDASINKGDTDNSLTNGDHLNSTTPMRRTAPHRTPAPAWATSITQGGSGTGGNADASGNVSSNDNKSSANIGSNHQQNGNISNDVTGGNIANSGGNNTVAGGSNMQGDIIGGSAAGGSAMGGSADVTGGSATTNSGAINTAGGHGGAGGSVGDTSSNSSIAGSGNSKNDNRNAQRQKQTATGGKSQQGQRQSANNAGNRQNTNIDASTRIRHSASTAYAPSLGGYGPGNCFGDTNPSGSFSAGVQTFGWGATAGSQKASNVCAIIAVGGPQAGAAYLAAMDPNAHRALLAAGVITTPSRVKARREARQERITSMPYTTCEIRDGAPYVLAKRGRAEEAVQACLTTLREESAPIAATPTCPAGSRWDGKGCYVSNLRNWGERQK